MLSPIFIGMRESCLVKLDEIKGDSSFSSKFSLILFWPGGSCLMEFDESKDSDGFSSKLMFVSGLVLPSAECSAGILMDRRMSRQRVFYLNSTKMAQDACVSSNFLLISSKQTEHDFRQFDENVLKCRISSDSLLFLENMQSAIVRLPANSTELPKYAGFC